MFTHSPRFILCRCILHSVPDSTPAEDLSRVSGQSADLIRQLSVSDAGLRGGAVQSHPGFHTWDFLQDQRYELVTQTQQRHKQSEFKLIFFSLSVLHQVEEDTVEFSWKRNRLFNHTACLVLYQICMEVCVPVTGHDVCRLLCWFNPHVNLWPHWSALSFMLLWCATQFTSLYISAC